MNSSLKLDNTVALIRYRSDSNSSAMVLRLHHGLQRVSTEKRIDDTLPFSPYGILGRFPLPGASHGENQPILQHDPKEFLIKEDFKWR